MRRFATPPPDPSVAAKLMDMSSQSASGAVPKSGPTPGSLAAMAAVRGPAEALAHLLAGNRRFVSGRPLHGHDVSAAAEAAASGDQQPGAVVVGCIDSRVPLEAIFDQTFGSICVVRSAGHVLDRAVLGSVEFAVSQLAVPLVVVLGHERCGAVASAVTALRTGQPESGSLGYLVDQIAPAVADVGLNQPNVHALAMRCHVARTVAVFGDDDRLAEATRSGRVDIVGAVYDLDTGKVDLID